MNEEKLLPRCNCCLFVCVIMIMRRGGERLRHEWIITCFYVGFDYQFELFTLRAISVIRRELFFTNSKAKLPACNFRASRAAILLTRKPLKGIRSYRQTLN